MNLSRVQEDRKEVGYALRAMARGKQKKSVEAKPSVVQHARRRVGTPEEAA